MLRLCLDLNIWVAALLADRKGRINTGSQYLVEIVRSGSSPVGAVNLIISLGMPDEFHLLYHYRRAASTQKYLDLPFDR